MPEDRDGGTREIVDRLDKIIDLLQPAAPTDEADKPGTRLVEPHEGVDQPGGEELRS